LAYVAISITLYALIRKIRLPFSTMVLSFGAFIAACGVTHFMEVWNLWRADYWTAGLVKSLTAIASVATAVWLAKLAPQIHQVFVSSQLSEQRREALELANQVLKQRTDELGSMNLALAEQQKLLAHSAKMSALGEMAGGIAHEINSPLGIITIRANQLERLQARGALSEDILAREAALIASTAKRIGAIIQGLRAFAREGANDPVETKLVVEIVEDALVLCQTRFKSNDVQLEIEAIEEGLTLECRSVQITQVVLNLLANAYDAVLPLVERWVRLIVRRQDEWVHITVVDSGAGISLEIQPKIMQPFFTTKALGHGTGLGLSISKGLVEAHGGTLTLETDAPNTTFVARLPFRARKTDGK